MARWWEFWRRDGQEPAPGGERAAAERPLPILVAVDRHGEPMSLAAVRSAVVRPPTTTVEIGASGTPVSGVVIASDDYNRELQGRSAVATFDKMRRGDGQVAAVLRLLKLPLLGADWEFIPPEGGDATDEEIAAFCNSALLDDDAMVEPWPFVLRHILLMLDFGFSVLEKVWTVGADGRYRFHRLAPRLPVSITEFRLDAATSALAEVVQRASKDGREQELVIPAEYAAVFTHDREGDNYNGISVLRAIYKHWYYKDQLYNIDAIGHERLGVGVPMAELEQGAPRGKNDMASTEEVLEGIRSHHRAYIVAPPGIRFKLLQSLKENTSLIRSVEHHDVLIARSVLAAFMNVGQASFGTRSSTVELVDLFFTAEEGIAQQINSAVKGQLTKPLCDLNFPMEGRQYPTLVARNVRRIDVQAMMTALKEATDGGVLTATDDIENALREALGYEPLPPELARPLARPDAAAAPAPGSPPSPSTGSRGQASGSSPEQQGVAQQLSALRAGTPLREPTEFESRVFSLSDVPRRLDFEIASLVSQLTTLRTQQVWEAAERLAAIDAESGDRAPFSRLRPQDFRLEHEGEVLRLLRRMQDAVATYGAEQVRLELRRQGAPVTLALDDDGALMLDEVVARAAATTPASVRSQMASSARATADSLNAQMRSVVLQEATRLRRTGLTGANLAAGIRDAAIGSAERNVATPVRGEVHEAFALGRAAEGQRNRDRIAYVVQSAILDDRTCSPCGAVDSQVFEFGSDAQAMHAPPYIHCRGRENCRCVQLFVYSGGGD